MTWRVPGAPGRADLKPSVFGRSMGEETTNQDPDAYDRKYFPETYPTSVAWAHPYRSSGPWAVPPPWPPRNQGLSQELGLPRCVPPSSHDPPIDLDFNPPLPGLPDPCPIRGCPRR